MNWQQIFQQPASPFSPREAKRAQSFVEFALTLPLMLLMISAAVEWGQIIATYNRIQIAAREGARFGAAGGTDDGIRTIVEQSVQESLVDVNEAQLGVWVVRPVINTEGGWEWLCGGTGTWGYEECDAGTPGEAVQIVNVYGSPVDGSGVSVGMANIVTPSEALADIASVGNTGDDYTAIDDSRFVVVGVYYRVDTILNLPFFTNPGSEQDEGRGMAPITAYAIMRQEVDQETINLKAAGCNPYAMAFNRELFQNDDGTFIGEGEPLRVNANLPASYYVDEPEHIVKNDLGVAPPDRTWSVTAWRYDQYGIPSFSHNSGFCDSPLQDKNECGALWPPGSALENDIGIGFIEYQDVDGAEGDDAIHRGDWVLYTDSTVNTANQPFLDHEATSRALRVIVYDYESGVNPGLYSHHYGWEDEPALGAEYYQYRVDDFAIIKVTDHSDSDKWASFEFVRWDTSCGYDLGE
ncbi:MAG: pilus assembly protein [Anaerolineae bacterium]|nr:pilus assembly protein [Anaerolineae bacterium]